ncbi:MAG: putative peptidoglycan lipid flippase [Phycisphaerales bacterium]|jgi:putative peptidoglycan lipid II flippase|nr:putative peptidoglycan lipid flippase [Phycisphaerales bacterium]
MSEPAVTISDPTAPPEVDPPIAAPAKSFLSHAKLIGGLTFVSRIVGMAREIVAGHFLGTGIVASAFTVAFTIPNLFRKLLGEGALSAAFIPLYAQAEKRGTTADGETARDFAAASVNLLTLILLAITLIGEAIIAAFILTASGDRPDRVLMLKFAAIMLPYVTFVCGGAFLSAILQVHKRFGPPAFAPILLNVCHIAVVIGGAWFLGLHGRDAQTPRVVALQTTLAMWLAAAVLVAGALQVAILLPALRQIGFRFRPSVRIWSPSVKKMLVMSIPVAIGAGVLQLSVLLDKGISYGLMEGETLTGQRITHFTFAGEQVRYPMELGATRRLEIAQLLYQFPLGVFAIALATAIFPSLSADALDADRDGFKRVLRQGIEATMWEGLPASIGLILVAEPATRLLFQHGQITAHDASLIARSTMVYAGAIWAFSLLQIINRAYYAVHDTMTPLVMSIVNIVLNLAVEIPLLWWMGEAAMAVGTLVSFAIQAVVMLWMLDRRIGGLGLTSLLKPTVKMLTAAGVMGVALWMIKMSPLYPRGESRFVWSAQLALMLGVGGGIYLAASHMMGLETFRQLLPKRRTAG